MKQGLDDYLAAGHTVDDLLALVTDELRPPPGAPGAAAERSAEAPPFPVEALPEPVQSLVREGAAALDVPPEFIAVPQLVCAGGTIGKRHCIELKPGYRQWPILYAA